MDHGRQMALVDEMLAALTKRFPAVRRRGQMLTARGVSIRIPYRLDLTAVELFEWVMHHLELVAAGTEKHDG